MPADTTVKSFHSAMPGAPTLNGTAGSLIAVLDACLVNGFGTGTVDSVVIAGGVATVTRSAGHPMEVDAVALLSGATVTGGSINGERKVLTVPTANTYTFDATGISNQTATGTITHKLAPAGFTKAFSSSNLAAYKGTNALGSQTYLRVDDTGTTNARVVAYGTMSDITPTTFTEQTPTNAAFSGGLFWGKSATADSTARPWILFADDRGLILSVNWNSGSTYWSGAWGDFSSLRPADAYNVLVTGANASPVSGSPGAQGSGELSYFKSDSPGAVDMYVMKGYTGTGASQKCRRSGNSPWGSSGNYSGAASGQSLYPNGPDNGLLLTTPIVCEDVPSPVVRGYMQGLYYSPQAVGSSTFAIRESVTGVVGLGGKTVKAINNGGGGVMFIDVTGPWR